METKKEKLVMSQKTKKKVIRGGSLLAVLILLVAIVPFIVAALRRFGEYGSDDLEDIGI